MGYYSIACVVFCELSQVAKHFYCLMLYDVSAARELISQMDHSNQTKIICVLKDAYGAFVHATGYLGTLFSEPEGGFVGKTDYHLMSDEEAAVIRKHDKAVLQTGKTLLTVEFVTTNGKKDAFLVKKIRLTSGRKNYVAVFGVLLANSENEVEYKSGEDSLNANTERLLAYIKPFAHP